jgi:hypothetical protein
MDDQKEAPKDDLIAVWDFLSNGRPGVFCRDFEQASKEMGIPSPCGDKLSPSLLTSSVLGGWWLFSPAHCPNNLAAAEIDAWRLLCMFAQMGLLRKSLR